MDTITVMRQWSYEQAKATLTDTATVEQIIAKAKLLEAYIDPHQNPDPKTTTDIKAG